MSALHDGGPAVGLVYCWYASIGYDDRVVTYGPQPLDEGWVLERLLAVNLIGNGSTILVRRSAFEAVGGYDPSLRTRGADAAEDFLICLRMAEQAEFRVVPRYLVGYRQVPGSMSTNSLRMFRATEMALLQYRAKFPKHADEIDAHLQDFRYWFGWGALKRRQWGEAASLFGQSVARRPAAAPLHLAGMAAEALKGRLFRLLGLRQPFLPIYTETIW